MKAIGDWASTVSIRAKMVSQIILQFIADVLNVSESDMRKQHVYDPLISKRQQYLLATQLVRAVLKVSAEFPSFAKQLIIYAID